MLGESQTCFYVLVMLLYKSPAHSNNNMAQFFLTSGIIKSELFIGI